MNDSFYGKIVKIYTTILVLNKGMNSIYELDKAQILLLLTFYGFLNPMSLINMRTFESIINF